MEYTHLGSSGLKVSRVAMGTMSFGEGDSGRDGWPIPYEDAVPFFRQALDLGITFWDTANGYNPRICMNEFRVRTWAQSGPNARD